MDSTAKTQRDALAKLRALLVIGAVVSVVGGVVMAVAWPATSQSLLGDGSQTGSWTWVWFGGAVALAGQAFLLVALVGYGVKLGREASR